MIKQLKDNLASVAALIAAIVAIGGGFVKYVNLLQNFKQLKKEKVLTLHLFRNQSNN